MKKLAQTLRDFIFEELRVVLIYLFLVAKHAMLDTVAHGPRGLTLLVFDLCEAAAVIRAIRRDRRRVRRGRRGRRIDRRTSLSRRSAARPSRGKRGRKPPPPKKRRGFGRQRSSSLD